MHNTATTSIHVVSKDVLTGKGKGLVFYHGFGLTPWGLCFMVYCEHGICHLQFTDIPDETCLKALQKQFSAASFISNNDHIQNQLNEIFSDRPNQTYSLYVQGTPFQVKVWQSLVEVAFGTLISYESLAKQTGFPQAVRAVASSVARNPVAYLIPCHRIIRKNGHIGQYRWGEDIKKALIAWEANKVS